MAVYASVDIGSNSLRMLIAHRTGEKITDIFSDRRTTRLGMGMKSTGRIKDEQMRASLKVLQDFAAIIGSHGVTKIRAVGTSALRRASNAESFIHRVLTDTGIAIDVISGEEEAELTMRGITASVTSLSSGKSFLALDIGGGSTEWILRRENHPLLSGSIPVGVIQIYEDTISSDPVTETDISRMHKAIVPALEHIRTKIKGKTDSETLFIGTAGTFTTIAMLDLGLTAYERKKIHLHTVTGQRLLEMERQMLPLTLKRRETLPGMDPGRADLIIPGLHFTIMCMDFLGFNSLIVSDYGLLEGALLSISTEDEKNI